MFGLMCWDCTVAYYREHGTLPAVGYLLKADGTESAVTMWSGTLYCRMHAEKQMRELGVGMEDD